MAKCCRSVPGLKCLLLVLFFLYVIIVTTVGIALILFEGECDGTPKPTGDVSHLVPFRHFCTELSKTTKPYRFEKLNNRNESGELSAVLNSLCNDYLAKIKINQTKCSKWTINNFIKYVSYASATSFTIGNNYVTLKTPTGIMIKIISAIVGMPIALSLLAVAGKMLLFKIWQSIKRIEKQCLDRDKVNHSICKVMLVVSLIFVSCIVLGSILIIDGGLADIPRRVAIHYWFESITTIGEIPVHFGFNKGWRVFLIIPYGILLFLGLVSTASLLTLFLKLSATLDWHGVCCCCSNCKRHAREKKNMRDIVSSVTYNYYSDFSGSEDEKEMEQLME